MEEAACQQHAFPSRHPPRRKSPWGKWRGFSEQILMKLVLVGALLCCVIVFVFWGNPRDGDR
ncbi:hypothetical protein F3J14_26715 [Burkholderia sp. Tr-862]|nr:hypothetical protein [Burkholderia sp. Tr-862]